MSISLQFYGAARHVTGSKHLLEVNGKRVLLDCGMVQGPRKISDKANRDLPFPADSIDAVVLSHAHIDHSGSLPRLVRLGFKGDIHCTNPTEDLLGLLLPDSAHIQAHDARYLRKKGHRVEPAYDAEDVATTLKRARGHTYHKRFAVCEGVEAEFFDAGHILGSSMVLLSVDDGSQRLRILFTGDFGRKDLPILRDPDEVPACDYLITESTYGDRLHPPRTDLQETLCGIVEEEIRDGGRILIPAFSVGRTQIVVYFLGNLMAEKRIPKLSIFVDSPLSSKATKVMAQNPQSLTTRPVKSSIAAATRSSSMACVMWPMSRKASPSMLSEVGSSSRPRVCVKPVASCITSSRASRILEIAC